MEKVGVKVRKEGHAFLKAKRTRRQMRVGLGRVTAEVWAEYAIPANHG